MNQRIDSALAAYRVTPDTPVGFELAPIRKRALIQLMGSRVWGRFNPNHWDPRYARETGLSAPIQTGEMSSAYLAEMCVNHFGMQVFVNARICLKYVASILANELITTHGVITGKTPTGDGCRFRVELWCDNEEGEKKTIGWAELDVGV